MGEITDGNNNNDGVIQSQHYVVSNGVCVVDELVEEYEDDDDSDDVDVGHRESDSSNEPTSSAPRRNARLAATAIQNL